MLEILVVVAVVSILAAVLLACVVRVRKQAQRTSCQSNLRQIALGLSLYQQDYDERTLVVNETSSYLWFAPLQPYIRSNQVFRCPAVPEPQNSPPGQPVTDYSLNGFYTHSVDVNSFQNVVEQVAIGERVKKVDGADYHPWDNGQFGPLLSKTLHFGGANYVFGDFHAKWYRWADTLSPAIVDPTSGMVVGMHNRNALPKPTTGFG